MAKTLYYSVTDEQRNIAAALTVAGFRLHTIKLRAGITKNAYAHITREPEWAALLANKQALWAQMLGGAA